MEMRRFKDLLADCFGGGFLVEAIIFFVYIFFYAFLFFCLSCFLLVQLFLLESLILAQDERWRRA